MKSKQQEYGNTCGQEKIETMILHVIDIIGRFMNKQKNRLSEHTRATCQNESNKFDDNTPMDEFCLATESDKTIERVGCWGSQDSKSKTELASQGTKTR